MRAAFTAWFELDKFGLAEHWPIQWSVGYVAFIVAYALALGRGSTTREHAALLIRAEPDRAVSRLAVSQFSRHGAARGRRLADRVVDDVAQSDCGRPGAIGRAGGDEVRGSGGRHVAAGAGEHLRIRALCRQRRSSRAQRGKRAGKSGESERRAARDARAAGRQRPHGRAPADLARLARRAGPQPHEPDRPPGRRGPASTGSQRASTFGARARSRERCSTKCAAWSARSAFSRSICERRCCP